MSGVLLLRDPVTARHAARAISEYRARHDDLPDDLEDLEWFCLDASRDASRGQDGSGAVTGQAAREDDPVLREWFTPQQTADLTGLSESTIKRRIADRSLASCKVGRSRRIHGDAISVFMEAAA